MDCDKRRIHYFRPIVVLGVRLGIYRLSDCISQKMRNLLVDWLGLVNLCLIFRLVATWFQSLEHFQPIVLYKDVWVL